MGNSFSSQSKSSESAPVPSSDEKLPRLVRKRRRLGPEAFNSEHDVLDSASASTSIPKRKRTGRSIPGDDEDVRNVTPVSMETEDISEEVDRRLRIKEELRRKKDAKPQKRKRESLASNESSHSSPRGELVKPRAKRAKVKDSSQATDKEQYVNLHDPDDAGRGNSDAKIKETGANVKDVPKHAKRRESDRSPSEERASSKRTKSGPVSNT